jgi:hypothetical protein
MSSPQTATVVWGDVGDAEEQCGVTLSAVVPSSYFLFPLATLLLGFFPRFAEGRIALAARAFPLTEGAFARFVVRDVEFFATRVTRAVIFA